MFVVRRVAPDETYLDNIPEPREQYVAAFADKADAVAFARRHNREYIRTRLPTTLPTTDNPFDLGFDALTSLPPPVLKDWLMDRGIDPPPEPGDPPDYGPQPKHMSATDWADHLRRMAEWHELQPWHKWWEATVAAADFPRDKLAVIWEAFDRVELFEVTTVAGPVPAGVQRVFAVVHSSWEYDDCNYCGGNEVLSVYRTRASAEAELQRRAKERDRARMEDGYDSWNGGPDEFVVVELPLPEGD
jgi:hypothetical protein